MEMKRARGVDGLVALLVAVVTAAACGGGNGSSASTPGTTTKSLVVVNTGGDWGACQRKSFFDPFTAKTGVEIVDGPFLTDWQVKALVQSKPDNVGGVLPAAD